MNASGETRAVDNRPTNEYLRFEKRRPEGFRTVVVDIFSTRSGHNLGRIGWWGPWRQYTFQPEDGSIWNTGCLATVSAYIDVLMAERRKRPTHGALAVGTFQDQRIHVRYGTSKHGPDWEVIEGDLLGHVPFDQLTDVEVLDA